MSSLSSWATAGRPWHLAQPLADLAAVLRGQGYTVGALGDESHLRANPPEDHTPFSATGWPVANPYPWVHAIDVMPAGGGLPSLAQLGQQIAQDKLSGDPAVAWLKYINWTNGAGQCQHECWTPGHLVRPSSDTGHIHLSARTDCTHAAGTNYDPVARLRGQQRPVPTQAPTEAGGAPAWPGRLLAFTPGHAMISGGDVRTWQAKMAQRGWHLGIDGVYGPESQGVCRQFQAEKHLQADGVVGPQTWAATWLSPVT